MTNKEKQITKGEIGNVVGGYPVFELIVDKKLKRVVLLDDVQKFLDKALKSQKKDIAEKIKNTGAWKDKKVKWILEEIISIITKEDE